MPIKTVEPIRRSLAEANQWIEDLKRDLGESSRHRAYSALRATLHAIRDYLSFQDVLDLAAAFPPVVRGFFLDGWRHTDGPSKATEPEDFLARIAERLIDVRGLTPARAARATFKLLSRLIAEGRLPDVRAQWHRPLSDFWPRPSPQELPWESLSDAERKLRIERTKEEIRASIEGARREGTPEQDLLALGPELSDVPARAGRKPPRERESLAGLDTFDKSLLKLGAWLSELSRTLKWGHSEHVFLALRAVLETLRDRVETDEAFQLAAQLPMILRGFYFEGWDPGRPLAKERGRGEFLKRVLEKLPPDVGGPAETIARAVFSLLSQHLTRGEVLDLRARLPKAVRELWPEGEAALPDEPRRLRAGRASASPGPRARARRARKEIRSALARARAAGVDDRDLPVLVSRRNVRKSSRGRRL